MSASQNFRRTMLSEYSSRRANKADAVQTHTLMDGGKLAVNDDYAFLQSYADAISAYQKLYVVELKTPVFRLFFDVDMHLPNKLECDAARELYMRISRNVLGAVAEVLQDRSAASSPNPLSNGDDERYELLACIADTVPAKKRGQECWKYGLHLHFPGIHVQVDTAALVRRAVVQKLCNSSFGAKPHPGSPTGWNEIIDSAVLGATGLRLLYSCKMQAGVDVGRPYAPLFILSGTPASAKVEDLQPGNGEYSIFDLVRKASIRSQLSVPTHEPCDMLPVWLEVPGLVSGVGSGCNGGRGAGGRRGGIGSVGGIAGGGGGGRGSNRRLKQRIPEGVAEIESGLREKVDHGDADCAAATRWVRSAARKCLIAGAYRKASVVKVFSFLDENNRRSQLILKLDSRHCENIGREHSTVTVFVHVNVEKRAAYMRCYCTCDTLDGRRRSGSGKAVTCKAYKSNPIPCSDLEIDVVRESYALRIVDDGDERSAASSTGGGSTCRSTGRTSFGAATPVSVRSVPSSDSLLSDSQKSRGASTDGGGPRSGVKKRRVVV